MLRFFSILFSLVILVQSFGISMGDIVKTNQLIAHAKYHNQKYQDNFLSFISKHYGTLKESHEKSNKEEKSQHEKLPFKQHTTNASFTLVLVSFRNFLISSDFSEKASNNFLYEEPTSSSHTSRLIQPPRQA